MWRQCVCVRARLINLYILRTEDQMIVEYKDEDYKGNEQVHFEVEFQVNYVCQNDKIQNLTLQFIGNFLHRAVLTITSPYIVFTKKTLLKKRQSIMAMLRIMLYKMNTHFWSSKQVISALKQELEFQRCSQPVKRKIVVVTMIQISATDGMRVMCKV